MSLPSPGPVDALMTWAQFKDLFERGIIQDPILYSGLTTKGTKFMVRRRVIVTRGLRTIVTNRLTLQSVIITDSLGTGVTPASFFSGTVADLGGKTARLINPSGSGKTVFLVSATTSPITGQAGSWIFVIRNPQSPSAGNGGGAQTTPLNFNLSTVTPVAQLWNGIAIPAGSALKQFAVGALAADSLAIETTLAGIQLLPNQSMDFVPSGTNAYFEVAWFEQ